MNQKITKNEVKDILNIVLCISAKDGILSETELRTAKEEFKIFFKRDLTNNEMENILKDFFLSNLQIEEYLERVNNEELRKPIMQLALISAASDGFDVRENLAYKKALSIWNFSHEMVLESE
jgi:hypothetical protein